MKQTNISRNSNQHEDEAEYALYCEALEEQYEKAKKDGVFEILKLLALDKNHSDGDLVQAIDYFNAKDGVIEKDAPINFLTERDKRIVNQNGKFRPHLYCMLLSHSLSEAIQNKSAFIMHSFKYAFDS